MVLLPCPGFAATQTPLPVLAADLQQYAVVLARAVIGRKRKLDALTLESRWLSKVRQARRRSKLYRTTASRNFDLPNIEDTVRWARDICGEYVSGFVWNAYGGYYFSPVQALTLDLMVKHLPEKEPERSVCLAATISAASACAASPGHTAQPLRPSQRAAPYIKEAWSRDPLTYSEKSLARMCILHANEPGKAAAADALEVASELRPKDLVIVDPPYSDVQYSRFYHVLECIATAYSGPVSGAGRYPPRINRPQSDFSRKGKSKAAMCQLLESLGGAGTAVILTFPAGKASNSLSGKYILSLARKHFNVDRKIVAGSFSTLGGFNGGRLPKKRSRELILLLVPKNAKR